MSSRDDLEQRRRQAQTDLYREGYSTTMAKALAKIDDPKLRNAIKGNIGRVGVKDGPIRVYAVKALAHLLGVGPAPVPPGSVGAELEGLIRDRTRAIADELAEHGFRVRPGGTAP